MKKIILITIISIFLFGCPTESYNDRSYIIENESNHSLLIKFYKEGNLLDYITTTLSENGEQYTGHITYENATYLFNFPLGAYDSSDSIVIDFDNLKRKIYTIDIQNETFSSPINRNIFKHENYEDIGNDRFLFKITEEDYINADDI